MTTLIIPDIHLAIDRAEKIIKHENCDFMVTTCDTMDDFNDTPDQVIEAAQWLNYSVNQSNRIHLYSNHLISYINKNFACSGWEQWKKTIIDQYCNWENTYSKLKWFYNLDNQFLLTHAGLDIRHLPPYLDGGINLKSVIDWLTGQAEIATTCLRSNRNHWFYKAGFSRGGDMPVGGIVWCDFRDEFTPIPNINQCVGHRPLNSKNKDIDSFTKSAENSINYDLDTIGHLYRYGVYNSATKKIEVKYYENL